MNDLDPGLRAFVERVRTIVRGASTNAAIVERLKSVATEQLSAPLPVRDEFRRLPAQGHGRNLVYRDQELGFVVVAMVWPPGARGLPHNHGTWGVVGVVEGEVDITNYERRDDGRDASRAELVEVSSLRAGPGAVAHVLPPHEDFHSVGNASEEDPALTLHAYGRDIESCLTVAPETGWVEVVRPLYTNETVGEAR